MMIDRLEDRLIEDIVVVHILDHHVDVIQDHQTNRVDVLAVQENVRIRSKRRPQHSK